ncbi:MAG: MBL fold metallo-hydrolase [Armatimonadota bacterium]
MEERARLCYRRGALEVWSGAVNVGVLRAGGRVLLVGGAPEGVLTRARVAPDQIDWVLVSHHHRDAACGALRAVRHGAKVAAPEAERRLLEGADEFWADDRLRLHAYSFHPSRLSVREPMAVSRGLRDGDALEWRGVTVKAIATPGPTDGEMTFVVECAGVRAAFIGDLMCGPGKLWEFHSLQGPLPSPGYGVSEYHGFGERARVMLASLDRVLAEKPDILVPTHGEVIHEPEQAVRLLRQRVEAVMASYWKTSSGRWYFHGARPEWPNDLTEMETRRCKLPNWIKEVGGTSRLIVADDGHCLLIDSDGDMPQRLLQRQKQGELGPVDALWITHYHDDHVGSVNAARSLLSCSVIAHESMADILRRPQAYFMPCVYPEPIEPDRVTKDGESWLWRGFKLTAYSFPGQTIYDAALLVEHDMTRVLFVGDSLTPGGLDDYCAYNRNLLGPAVGYQHCLGLLERLGVEDLIIVNQHVERGFRFSREFVSELSAELTKRHELFADLFPWDSPNYGLDPAWVRCDPYYQRAHHKQVVSINVVVRNHSKVRRETVVSLRLPQGWSACTGSGRMRTPAGKQGTVRLSARVPDACPAGRYVFGVAVRHAGRDLGELAEAIVEVAD